jgi:hypothetical protein
MARSSESVRVEISMRVVHDGDTTHVICVPKETGPYVPTSETSRLADPREITVPVENAAETGMRLLETPAPAESDLVHAHAADPLGGTGVRGIVAIPIPADQSLHRTSSPIHDGQGQNADQRVPNVTEIGYLSNHIPLRLEPQPILANRHKSRRRSPPPLQLYGVTISKTIRTLWKISLVRCLHRFMARALPLLFRVAGVHTIPAPAPLMPTLLRTTILQTIFHLMMSGLRL